MSAAHATAGPPRPLVVGLGEALFDCLPDRVVLGGAPINVAVHAGALLAPRGGAAVPATRVGRDELGDRFFAELGDRGLSPAAVQVDPRRPTGRATVHLDDHGQAAYRFEPDCAWDAFEWTPEWARLAADCDAVAFGTLAQRAAPSRRVVARFLATAERAVRLFDVNLRGDFYSADLLADSLRLATAAKLNAEELVEVTRLLGLANAGGEANPDDAAHRLRSAFDLDWLALTRGADGTVLYRSGERHEALAPNAEFPRDASSDAVGAGDACCAALLTGTLLGWPPARTLALANRVGAYVASQPGATPPLPPSLVALTVDAAETDHAL